MKIFAMLLLCALLIPSYSKAQENENDGCLINVKVNYPASLFMTVDNVSQWAEYYDGTILEFWKKHYSITQSQNLLLADYAVIRKKYKWGYIEGCFLNAGSLDEALTCTGAKLDNGELAIIKNTLNSFKDNFDILWNSGNYLFERKSKIESEINRLKLNNLPAIIARLYGYKNGNKNFVVNLLFNPISNNSDGGADGGIFIRNGKDIPVEEDLMVMLHEIAHTLSDSLKNMLFNIAGREGVDKSRDKNILQEAVDYTLFPAYFYEVYLNKPFNLKQKSDLMKGRNKYLYAVFGLAGDIYDDAVKIINIGGCFDREFILKEVIIYKDKWMQREEGTKR